MLRFVCAKLLLSPRVSPDLASTFSPLDPTPEANFLVPNELPEHIHPALVVRKRVVELTRYLVEEGQSRPRNGGEVVVFIM